MILRLLKNVVFQIKKMKTTKIYLMWLNKVICMGGTDQLGTNTWHHNKKLNYLLNNLHLFWDFPKSLINEYGDTIVSELQHRISNSNKNIQKIPHVHLWT